jgi:polyphosphate glucokinase
MAAVSLGVDVGGSSIKFGRVTAAGTLHDSLQSIPTPQPATAAAMLESLAALARSRGAGLPVGMALPSVIRQGVIHTAANLDASLIGVDAGQALHAALRTPVVLLNDADAAGVAEARAGAARGVRGTVMVLTFGTGIGSALFSDGRLVPNFELGHMEVDGQEAEARASARARTAEALDWPQWAGRVNRFLDAVNALFWPELIVIGGGVSESFSQFGPLLRSRAAVRPAMHGPAAGVVGAALAALDAA